jgi:proteasome beta subunit
MKEEISNVIIKTGTLTLGLVCKDGLVVAADKKVTYGGSGGVSYIAGTLTKIIPITDAMIATIAGTASDGVRVLQVAKAEIRLKELRTRTKASVEEVANLLSHMSYQGIRTPSMIPQIAHFLLAGYDENGLGLFDISPDGFLKKEEGYVASGSGIMQAHPILDSEYKKEITIEEGVKLASKCIKASMGRDPGVGAGMDIYVIKKGEIKQVFDKEVTTEFK